MGDVQLIDLWAGDSALTTQNWSDYFQAYYLKAYWILQKECRTLDESVKVDSSISLAGRCYETVEDPIL
jgi:hypothetical protein